MMRLLCTVPDKKCRSWTRLVDCRVLGKQCVCERDSKCGQRGGYMSSLGGERGQVSGNQGGCRSSPEGEQVVYE